MPVNASVVEKQQRRRRMKGSVLKSYYEQTVEGKNKERRQWFSSIVIILAHIKIKEFENYVNLLGRIRRRLGEKAFAEEWQWLNQIEINAARIFMISRSANLAWWKMPQLWT